MLLNKMIELCQRAFSILKDLVNYKTRHYFNIQYLYLCLIINNVVLNLVN